MSDDVRALQRAKACQEALMRDGVRDRACTMVLFAMAEGDLGYVEALKAWAEYEDVSGWDEHRWHSEICYTLLKAWILEGPGLYFDKKLEELRSDEN